MKPEHGCGTVIVIVGAVVWCESKSQIVFSALQIVFSAIQIGGRINEFAELVSTTLNFFFNF